VNNGKLHIESLSVKHLPAVAQLHLMGLTRDFRGWAGARIMALFYRELLASQSPPPGFVAVLDGRVVGFAVAVADARAIKRRVLARWGWWLAVLALVQFVTHPRSLLARGLRRWHESRTPHPPWRSDPLEQCCPPPRIEFRGIVVDPAAHCPGAPLALMRARLSWAKAAGYRSVYFQIDHDNEASIRLCRWAGAQPVPNDTHPTRLRFYTVL
jgi:GNAT superfamily N-acetyltransferase